MLHHFLFFFLAISLPGGVRGACDSSELDHASVDIYYSDVLVEVFPKSELDAANAEFLAVCKSDANREFAWNGNCDDPNYAFARDVFTLKEDIGVYCDDLFSKCSVSDISNALVPDLSGPPFSYDPGSNAISVFCLSDASELDAIAAECSSTAVWLFTAKGSDMTGTDFEVHCARYATGCALSGIDAELDVIDDTTNFFSYQPLTTSLTVQCTGDERTLTQNAVCESGSWVYYEGNSQIQIAMSTFCEGKRRCLYSELSSVLEQSRETGGATASETVAINCDDIAREVSLAARCGGSLWTYVIGGVDREVSDVEVYCRADLCLREEMPLTAITLLDAAYDNANFIENDVTIQVACLDTASSEYNFVMECLDATLKYTKNEVLVEGPINTYCDRVYNSCKQTDLSTVFQVDSNQMLPIYLEESVIDVYCELDADKKYLVRATCNEAVWDYSHNKIKVTLPSDFCRDDVCKRNDFPMASVTLLDSTYDDASHIANEVAIQARCHGITSSEYDFVMECKNAALIYTKNEIPIEESIDTYCDRIYNSCKQTDLNAVFQINSDQVLSVYVEESVIDVYCEFDATKNYIVKATCIETVWNYSNNNSITEPNDFCQRIYQSCNHQDLVVFNETFVPDPSGSYMSLGESSIQTTCIDNNRNKTIAIICNKTQWMYLDDFDNVEFLNTESIKNICNKTEELSKTSRGTKTDHLTYALMVISFVL